MTEKRDVTALPLSPLDRAKAGLDVTMACAEGSPFIEQHKHCRGTVNWDGVPVGTCACPCHEAIA